MCLSSGGSFFPSLFQKEAQLFGLLLFPSTNGRSVRLKASPHRTPILQAHVGRHRIAHFYAVSTRAHVHAITDTDCLTIIGTGWLLALSAAAAGKLAREEDWPALIPKSGRVSDFTNGARGKRECFEQLRERVPRDKHSDRKIETLNLESARLEKL